MTTSVYTSLAEEQATSPGYKPIDLIDGERLIELLVQHRLGIRQLTVDHRGSSDEAPRGDEVAVVVTIDVQAGQVVEPRGEHGSDRWQVDQ